MLLTIDVGNTNITCGVMDGNALKAKFRITTKIERTSDELGLLINQFLIMNSVDPFSIDAIVMGSVVPTLNHAIVSACIKSYGIEPFIIGPGIKTGIQIKTDNPKELGADRLISVVAAFQTYQQSCLIIDFGTATTFDYISSKGEFSHTIICPGAQISANALWKMTAKLPEIEIVECQTILAKNTIAGMQAGIYYGYKGLVENIIHQILKELKDNNVKIIATGGLGRLFSKSIECIDVYDPDLLFKGMKILYDKNHTNM